MEECKPVLNTGLRGVVIADTRICDVDGANGRLIYRGYLIQDLAKRATFEETTYLLLYEKLPDTAELEEFRRRLRAQQGLPAEVIAALKLMPKDAMPMDVEKALRAGFKAYIPKPINVANTCQIIADLLAVEI